MPRLGTSLETYASQEAHDWLQGRERSEREATMLSLIV